VCWMSLTYHFPPYMRDDRPAKLPQTLDMALDVG
jgi:hypothetical protein